MHYGLWVVDERDNGQKVKAQAGDENRLIPVMNYARTIEELIEEHGFGMSLVVRRRVFPPEIFLKVDRYLGEMDFMELEMLFMQCQYENLKLIAYNEEEIALK